MPEEEFQPSVPIPPENENLGEEFSAEKIPVGWPWRLLLISFVLLGLSILTYAGLTYGYQPYLKTSLNKVDNQINDLANQVNVEDQEKLLTFYSQVINLKDILDRRVFSSKIFPFLEKNTDPSIYFTSADFSAVNKNLKLKGMTSSFGNLMQELTILKQAPEAANVLLDDTNVKKNKVGFSLTVVFKPDFFNQINQ